jgi:hypothetical protein
MKIQCFIILFIDQIVSKIFVKIKHSIVLFHPINLEKPHSFILNTTFQIE